jgi:magnesium chelatase family protein
MFARLLSAVVVGIDAELVEVQCDVANGLPAFQVVGLPEKEVTESRERIRSAIKNSGYSFPAKRITANLAPADLRKEGVGFDLPSALGILVASGQIHSLTSRYLVLGELSLNGEVRRVHGVLPIALRAKQANLEGMIVPEANATEAALVDGVAVYPVRTLAEAATLLSGEFNVPPFQIDRDALMDQVTAPPLVDIVEVKGQEQAKRALEVAAAGGHNLLMIGPPGAGKSLLARCMPGILPPLSLAEALEVTRVYSIAGMLDSNTPLITQRPFRSPHHTISYAGMVGGGRGLPGPGEITLAHHGVLFLDELPEFDRRVVETLRQPLEDRSILLSRAGASVRYPSNFTLIGAMNPCPCGHLGDHLHPCTCNPHEIRRYRKRLSGPFLDRIDLFVEVPRLTPEELLTRPQGEDSHAIRTRVEKTRRIQWERMKDKPGRFSNAELNSKEIAKYCALNQDAKGLLEMAIDRFALSARAYTRVLRVARTIADLSGAPLIRAEHLAEAIQYRSIDEDLA